MSSVTEKLRSVEENIMSRLRPFIMQFRVQYPESAKLFGDSMLDVVIFLIWGWSVIEIKLIFVQAASTGLRRKVTKKSFKVPKPLCLACATPLRH
jgi:hypothetical protein